MKVKHTSALELTKTLVKEDSTWIQLHSSKIEDRTIDIAGGTGLDKSAGFIPIQASDTVEEQTDDTNQKIGRAHV